MDNWNTRIPEIAYLLNPAFCAAIIYIAIFEYQKKSTGAFPFTLSYLLLPIILHKNTRERVSSRTNMATWLQRNSDSLLFHRLNFAILTQHIWCLQPRKSL
jgi:hypothetical protein